MPDSRTSYDPVGARIAAGRSSDSQEQIGSSGIFMPEQSWMIDQISLDVVDQEDDNVILE